MRGIEQSHARARERPIGLSRTLRECNFTASCCQPNLFGQNRTLKLRLFARFVQSGRFAFFPLTRSLAHICGEIARHREISKMGSTPVRAAKLRNFRVRGTARAFKSDSINKGRIYIKAPEAP
jgi:hypothetical protein